jgi:hypothetical protein
MALPSYEDWTSPWGEDEIDRDKASRLVYNLHSDKERLQARIAEVERSRDEFQSQLTEHEQRGLSELEKAQRELEALRSAPPKVDEVALARYEIALDKGLTRAQAKRLVGSSREELEADAEAYIAEHSLNGSRDEGQVDRPPSRRPQGRLQTGLDAGDDDTGSTDPASLAGHLPPRRF